MKRGIQHMAAMRLEDEENARWKHCMIEHDGTLAQFEMKIFKPFTSCLERQVNKTIHI